MEFQLTGTFRGEPLLFPLTKGTHRLGRSRQMDLYLQDPSVSREHAELRIEEERVIVEDLGSHNGTWVNGRRIHQPTPISPGDQIRLGDLDLVLRSPQAPPGAGGATPATVVTDSETLFSDGKDVQTSYRLRAGAPGGPRAEFTPHDSKLLWAVTEAGQLLTRHAPLSEVFEGVLDLVQRVVPARRILLLMSRAEGEAPEVRAARPPLMPGERLMLSRTLVDEVLKGRESLLVTDARMDSRFAAHESILAQDIRAAMIAPLFDNEQVIGLVYADASDPRVLYDQDQLRVLTLLANLVASKITNTRLLEDQRAKELYEQELETAARIVETLLPSKFPEKEGIEIAARQISCRMVGGDLYDVQLSSRGEMAFLLGDVSGKGIGAALLMSNVLASLRILLEEDIPLLSVVERLNNKLLQTTATHHYLTLFLARLDPTLSELEYVNAGHNPPLLFRPDGTMQEIASTGLPVGLMPGIPHEAGSVPFPPGSLLCVYSDGISEAARGEEEFGDRRLRESIESRLRRPLPEIAGGMFDDVRAFLGEIPFADDTTLLLVRRGQSG